MAPRITIEYTKDDLLSLVMSDIRQKFGDVDIRMQDIHIEVRASQNFKAEWERGDFRAVVKTPTTGRSN